MEREWERLFDAPVGTGGETAEARVVAEAEADEPGFDIRKSVPIDPEVRHRDAAFGPGDVGSIDPWVPGDDPADAPRIFAR
jgi:hypothetical protein